MEIVAPSRASRPAGWRAPAPRAVTLVLLAVVAACCRVASFGGRPVEDAQAALRGGRRAPGTDGVAAQPADGSIRPAYDDLASQASDEQASVDAEASQPRPVYDDLASRAFDEQVSVDAEARQPRRIGRWASWSCARLSAIGVAAAAAWLAGWLLARWLWLQRSNPPDSSVDRKVPDEEKQVLSENALDIFRHFVSKAVPGDYVMKDISTTSPVMGAEFGLKRVVPKITFKAVPDTLAKFVIDFEVGFVAKTFIPSHLVHLAKPVPIDSSNMRVGEGVQKLMMRTNGAGDQEECFMYRMFMRKTEDGTWVDPMDIFVIGDLVFFYNKCIPYEASTVGDVNIGMYMKTTSTKVYKKELLEDVLKNVRNTRKSLDPSTKDQVTTGAPLSPAALLDEMEIALANIISRI